MESVTLRVLGQLAATDATGRVSSVRGARNRQVLSALALGVGRPVGDDALVEALWPDDDLPPDVAATLRTYVARVRQVGAGFDIARVEGGYRLDLDPGLIDATAFEQRATAGLAAWRSGQLEHCRDELGAALALWAGDPWVSLPDWHPAIVDAARLTELHQTVVEHDAAARLSLGETDGVGDLRALVDAAPLRELRWELLIRALAADGRAADALRCYQEARRHLLDEIGIEPSDRLRALDAAIAAGRPLDPLVPVAVDPPKPAPADASTHEPTGPPTATVEAGPLIDRTGERATLRDAVATLHSGPRVLAITGEPGIGKSRLADELAAGAVAAGMAVVTTRCHEAEGSGAYRAMLGAVAELVALGGGASEEVDHLRILMPHLSVEPDLDALGEDRRLRLFDSLARLVARVAERSGLVLLVDDLQWIDGPSASLLGHVIRHNPASALLVAATHRRTDGDAGAGPAVELLTEAARTATVTRVHLEGLAAPDAATLFEQSRTRPGSTSEIDLVGLTNGNPLFLRELGRLIDERGDVAAAVADLPPSVTSLLDERLHGTPAEEMDLLRLLAISPGSVALEQLARTSPLDRAALIELLESTIARGLVVERVDAGEIAYEFSHGLFRLVLEDQLSLARRAALHHQLALATTDLVEGRAERWTAPAAYHWFAAGRSGDPAQALAMNRRAGELALAGTAYEDAVTLFERALDAAGWLGRDDAATTAELHLGAAEACSRAGFFERRRHHAEESFRLARDAGRRAVAARAALVHGGTRSIYGSPNAETTELLRGALALFEDAEGDGGDGTGHPASVEDRDLRAMLTARYAQEVNHNGHFDESRRLTAAAVELAATTGDDRVAASVFRERIWTLNHPDHLDERVATIDRMVRTARSAGDPELEMEARVWNAAALLERGEPEAFEAEVGRLVELRSAAPVPALLVRIATLEATLALTRAAYEEGMALAQANYELGLRVEPENAEQVLRAQMIAPLRDTGLLPVAAGEIDAIVAELGDGYVQGWRCAAAFALSEAGELERAGEVIDGLVADGLDSVRRDLSWAQALTYLADAVANCERADVADDLWTRLAPFTGRQASLWDIATNGAIDHHLGRLALLRGDPRSACRLLDAAVTQNERARVVSAGLWSRWARATAEVAAGAPRTEPPEAIAADATAAGITAVADRCRSL